MANKDGADVVAKISRSGYAELFRQAFGAGIFADPQTAFQKAGEAFAGFPDGGLQLPSLQQQV